jgi:hypothetical protein
MPAVIHRVADEWRTERLLTNHAVLGFDPARIAAFEAPPSRLHGDTIELMRLEKGRKWIAIVPAGLQITHNGQPVAAGLRVLAHGDALAAANGAPVFFSTEETAFIEAFAGTEPVSCPRCKLEIVPGQPVVRCPDCGVFHHELADDRNCWTYASTCALCPRPTALDATLRWSPESL